MTVPSSAEEMLQNPPVQRLNVATTGLRSGRPVTHPSELLLLSLNVKTT